MDVIGKVLEISFILVAVKALLIGSEFQFYYYFKYGKKYWDWYHSRPRFKVTNDDCEKG